MRRYIERSSDAGPFRYACSVWGCIVATRGYDFREGQVNISVSGEIDGSFGVDFFELELVKHLSEVAC